MILITIHTMIGRLRIDVIEWAKWSKAEHFSCTDALLICHWLIPSGCFHREVTVIRLIAKNTIDESMLACAKRKLQLEKEVTAADIVGGNVWFWLKLSFLGKIFVAVHFRWGRSERYRRIVEISFEYVKNNFFLSSFLL